MQHHLNDTLQAIQLYPAIFWKQHKDRKQQTDRTHGSLGKYFGDLLEPSLNILRSKFAPKSSAKKQLKFVFQKKTPLSITSFTSIFYIDLPFTSFLPFHLDRRRLRIPSRHRTTAHLTGLVVQRNNLIRVLGCAKKKGEIYETQKKRHRNPKKCLQYFLPTHTYQPAPSVEARENSTMLEVVHGVHAISSQAFVFLSGL